jgi:hypothetical protein
VLNLSVLSGCYAWYVGHLAPDTINICTLTHQSELMQHLLGSTSQLGDMPGLQSTQAKVPSGDLLLDLTMTWALGEHFYSSGCTIDVVVLLQ